MKTCESCKFMDMKFGHGSDVKWLCRINPPVATGGMMNEEFTMWPTVTIRDWCGKYEPHKPLEDEND